MDLASATSRSRDREGERHSSPQQEDNMLDTW